MIRAMDAPRQRGWLRLARAELIAPPMIRLEFASGETALVPCWDAYDIARLGRRLGQPLACFASNWHGELLGHLIEAHAEGVR